MDNIFNFIQDLKSERLLFLAAVVLLACFIYVCFLTGKRYFRSDERSLRQKNQLLNNWLKILLFILFIFVFGSYSFFIVYLIAFFFLILTIVISPNDEQRFIKYQDILPTSKIRSMAMGLVELQGKLSAKQLVKAPLSKKNCIGYYHTVHEKKRDTDGKECYRLIQEKKYCQPFILQDNTGTVQVDGKKITFHLFPIAGEVTSMGKIIREYILLPGEDYLVIGQASRKDDRMVIIHDPYRRIFGISPINYLKRKRKLNGLIHTYIFYAIFMALLISLMLTLPVEINGRNLLIKYTEWPLFILLSPISFGLIK